MKNKLLTRTLEVAARLVLTLSLLLVVAPPVLAQDPVPSGSYAPNVWAPQSGKWENGLPRGYAETESAAFAVEIKGGLTAGTYFMELGLQASQKGTPTSYGFSAFSPWDVSYQPAALPDGTPVDYGYPAADWDRSHPNVWGYNVTILDVQPITYIKASNGNYEMMALVTFTTNGATGFLVFGGRFAAPGDPLPAPIPADLDSVVPGGQGASSISGTFQARLGSGGDKTVNFKGSDIEPAIASLAIDKVGSATTVEIGETVTYTVTVTNDGQLNLSGVVLSDPLLGLDNYLVPGSMGAGILLGGESVQVVGTYTPDENDYWNNNPLVNTATADSNETDPVTDTWSVDTPWASATRCTIPSPSRTRATSP